MGQITSISNERVRRAQALLRSARRRMREGLIVLEGLRLVREAWMAGSPIAELFFTAEFAAEARGAALVKGIDQAGASLWEVPPQVLVALSDTETPQGVVAVVSVPTPVEAPSGGLILIPDQVRDPGNLGTILRAAWAAGVWKVLLPPGTVDPLSPKVLRAAMGAHFYLPILRLSWEEIGHELIGRTVWLAEAGQGTSYDAVDWSGPVALIVGGEAEGAGVEARALAAGHHVCIPMASGVESLNAAVATAVLLFEAARQRRE